MPGFSTLLLPLIAPLASANDEASRSASLRCSVHLEGTLPQPVRSAGSTCVQGRGDGEDLRHSLTVLRKDLADAEGFRPTELQLPRPRRAFGCAVLDGRAYLVGGLADGFEPVAECDVLDLERSAWTSIPPPSRARISPELVALGDKLYLAGGAALDEDGESRPERSLEVFDPASGTWSTLIEELPIRPAHIRLFAHRGRLLAFSTQREGEGEAELCWIDPN